MPKGSRDREAKLKQEKKNRLLRGIADRIFGRYKDIPEKRRLNGRR